VKIAQAIQIWLLFGIITSISYVSAVQRSCGFWPPSDRVIIAAVAGPMYGVVFAFDPPIECKGM
jgi:hypothetical protein